jgi:hypothetical protein
VAVQRPDSNGSRLADDVQIRRDETIGTDNEARAQSLRLTVAIGECDDDDRLLDVLDETVNVGEWGGSVIRE